MICIRAVRVVLFGHVTSNVYVDLRAFRGVTASLFRGPMVFQVLSQEDRLITRILCGPTRRHFSSLSFLRGLRIFFLLFQGISSHAPRKCRVCTIKRRLRMILYVTTSSNPITRPTRPLRVEHLAMFSRFNGVVTRKKDRINFAFHLRRKGMFLRVFLIFRHFSFERIPFKANRRTYHRRRNSYVSCSSFRRFVYLAFPWGSFLVSTI